MADIIHVQGPVMGGGAPPRKGEEHGEKAGPLLGGRGQRLGLRGGARDRAGSAWRAGPRCVPPGCGGVSPQARPPGTRGDGGALAPRPAGPSPHIPARPRSLRVPSPPPPAGPAPGWSERPLAWGPCL